jgi:hypothetical protein
MKLGITLRSVRADQCWLAGTGPPILDTLPQHRESPEGYSALVTSH